MASTKYRKYLIFAITIYIVFFSVYSILRHYSYFTSAYDLGIFMQSLWTTSHGGGFFFNTPEWEDIGTYSHFGIHNQPILFLVVPIYWAFPSAETLLVLQTIALGFGAATLFRFANLILKDEKRALYLSMMYLMNPFIHGINRFDFHPVSLIVPFIFLIPYYYETRQYIKMLLTSFLVLSAKEDAGLILISLALLFMFKKHSHSSRTLSIQSIQEFIKENVLEISLLLLGVIWIAFSIFIVIPHFNEGFYPYTHNSKLQRYVLSISRFHLDYVIVFVFVTLLGVAFIPVLNLRYLFASIFLWIELVAPSTKLTIITIGFQYLYMLVPFLFITSVYTLSEIKEAKLVFFSSKNDSKQYPITLKKTIGLVFVAMLLFSPVFHVLSMPYISGLPIYKLIHIQKNWEPYSGVLDNITEIVKKSSCPISTQNSIFPHLANSNITYVLLTPFNSSYIPNNSIILLASSLPDYKITAGVLNNTRITEGRTYFVLNVNEIILSCYNQTGDYAKEFNAYIAKYTKQVINECEQARSYASKK